MYNQQKKAIWLDEMDMEILGGFVAELLDRKKLDYYQVDILEDVLNQITEGEKGE